jgi:hypothetical protein
MPGDISVTDVISDPGYTDHPPILEIDAASLALINTNATEQPAPSSIQPSQAFGGTTQPTPPDSRLLRAGSPGDHPEEMHIQPGDAPDHPMSPHIQGPGQSDAPQPHQTVGDTGATVNTEQAPSPHGQPHQTGGVTSTTNPTAVRLARDPLGKRSHPGYTRMTVYVQKKTHDDFKLVTDLAREEMSEIVEKLIGDYAKARKKDLVRSFAG